MGVFWANLHLLFWLALVPFATRWIGENHYAALPTAVYGLNLLLAAVAYWILQQAIISNEGKNSLLLYALAVLAAFAAPWLAQAVYVLVALIWIIPDRRIEQALLEE
ncbi:TMEM175 family protein [Synechococcus sp. EJ6-Ellesmere]|uniref:TMEM175 family protein n=1 Tax=Synechococcus sp. EJ6-Ellesmere TaxID=2823734 RepID=UPI0020CD3E63|nr:hypothetical protein [Synechococcus sp. EJ6-Ellesmere]MCP9825640.1 hypothetical protein [Synechococcus sp. EJ6-Ellesmere]